MRWDLFEGGEHRGRERLVMDFFGNVQGVEVGNETEWRDDLRGLKEVIEKARALERAHPTARIHAAEEETTLQGRNLRRENIEGAAKVEARNTWGQSTLGAAVLLGCVLLWGGVSWYEAG